MTAQYSMQSELSREVDYLKGYASVSKKTDPTTLNETANFSSFLFQDIQYKVEFVHKMLDYWSSSSTNEKHFVWRPILPTDHTQAHFQRKITFSSCSIKMQNF